MQAEGDQSPPVLKGDLGVFSNSYPKIPPGPPLRKGGTPRFAGVKLTPMRGTRDFTPRNDKLQKIPRVSERVRLVGFLLAGDTTSEL